MKKFFSTALLALTALAVFAQKYDIDFYAEGAGGNLRMVYLLNAETKAVIDSFVVDHERACLTGTYAGLPVLASIANSPRPRQVYATFVLDATPTKVDYAMPASGSQISTVSIKGSDNNNRMNEIQAESNAQLKKLYQLSDEFRSTIPSGSQPTAAQIEDYQAKMAPLEEGLKKVFEKGLQTERNNKVSLYCLTEGAQLFDTDFLAQYLEGYPFAQSPMLQRIRTDIESKKLRAPGASFIDFEMADQAGTMHKLSEYVGKGRYVMVDFWASWCGPCRQEMPNVKAAYERFHDKGFDIVAVSFDNNRDAWLKGIADLGMTWTQLSDLQGWNCAAGQLYKIHAIPCTILFGPDGKVVASDLRGEALAKMLEEKLP